MPGPVGGFPQEHRLRGPGSLPQADPQLQRRHPGHGGGGAGRHPGGAADHRPEALRAADRLCGCRGRRRGHWAAGRHGDAGGVRRSGQRSTPPRSSWIPTACLHQGEPDRRSAQAALRPGRRGDGQYGFARTRPLRPAGGRPPRQAHGADRHHGPAGHFQRADRAGDGPARGAADHPALEQPDLEESSVRRPRPSAGAEGRAIVATGTAFEPVGYDGQDRTSSARRTTSSSFPAWGWGASSREPAR